MTDTTPKKTKKPRKRKAGADLVVEKILDLSFAEFLRVAPDLVKRDPQIARHLIANLRDALTSGEE